MRFRLRDVSWWWVEAEMGLLERPAARGLASRVPTWGPFQPPLHPRQTSRESSFAGPRQTRHLSRNRAPLAKIRWPPPGVAGERPPLPWKCRRCNAIYIVPSWWLDTERSASVQRTSLPVAQELQEPITTHARTENVNGNRSSRGVHTPSMAGATPRNRSGPGRM